MFTYKTPCHALMMIAVIGLLLVSPAAGQSNLTMPDWMSVDHAAKTISIEIIAGKSNANNNWNFNGFANGEASVVVPEGYAVSLTFKNNDPNMVHSIGVGERLDAYPAMMENATPVFTGAMSTNPTDMMNATKSGASETLSFSADKAGDYALICYIPAHATTGMWIGFSVSAEGKAGLSKG